MDSKVLNWLLGILLAFFIAMTCLLLTKINSAQRKAHEYDLATAQYKEKIQDLESAKDTLLAEAKSKAVAIIQEAKEEKELAERFAEKTTEEARQQYARTTEIVQQKDAAVGKTDAGEGFYYQNVILKPDDYGVRMLGEIVNETGDVYSAAELTVNVYDYNNKLFDTNTITVINIPNDASKTFDIHFPKLQKSKIAGYTIKFNYGFKTK